MAKMIFSGVQPTGALHLGNYLGAIRRFARLPAPEDQSMFCVVDLHAMTVRHDPITLYGNTRTVAAAFLASGVTAPIFAQSMAPGHTDLAWVLQCVARVGWLDRMTQFREKTGAAPSAELDRAIEGASRTIERLNSGGSYFTPLSRTEIEEFETVLGAMKERRTHKEKASVGLYTYPVLQAADILLYGATHVPVGQDQLQHLNLAADIAEKFNSDFGDTLVVPKAIVGEDGARVMDLKTGLSKMSKSVGDDGSRINLTDSDDDISKKIKRATADTRPIPATVEELSDMPTVRNLLGIMAAIIGCPIQHLLNGYAGKGYGALKPDLALIVIDEIRPVREEMKRLLADPAYIDQVLCKGAVEARLKSRDILREVYNAVGLTG